MSSSNANRQDEDSEPEMLAADDALEEVGDAEGDTAMDSDNEEPEEITLQNDSIAYFDKHKDSVFAITQHPRHPSLIATGGSEGDTDDAPGKGYVFDTSAAQPKPLLPPSYNSDPSSSVPRTVELESLFALDGHTDSINAMTFTQPNGECLYTAGMDGRLRVYKVDVPPSGPVSAAKFTFLAESQEVSEINWLSPSPSPTYPDAVALGASDGSVWVYDVDPSDSSYPLRIVQSYFLHTAPCTAGAWTPDGSLLATVSEDGSLCVWDVWGNAAAKGLLNDNGQTVVQLTAADQRFEVEGGLYSIAVAPNGPFLATGGAGGVIKVVGLPSLSENSTPKNAPRSSSSSSSAAAAGTILASLSVQSDGIETLAFSPGPAALLAAGSVDGSIAVFDTARRFGTRRLLQGAHEDFSVVRVEFVPRAPGPAAGWLLTSCGMDGVVRRWDLRGAAPGQRPGAASAAASGLVKEWKGHRGDGEGGGVLGFVQGDTGERIVTAGDDGIVLVFEV